MFLSMNISCVNRDRHGDCANGAHFIQLANPQISFVVINVMHLIHLGHQGNDTGSVPIGTDDATILFGHVTLK